MRINYEQLRGLVKQTLFESSNKNVTLSDGNNVPVNSPDHIRDMQTLLAGLEALKKQHRYGSADRAAFADASVRLKRTLKKAEANAKSVTPEDIERIKPVKIENDYDDESFSPRRVGHGSGMKHDPSLSMRK